MRRVISTVLLWWLQPHPLTPSPKEREAAHSPRLFRIHHCIKLFFKAQFFFEPHKDIGHIMKTHRSTSMCIFYVFYLPEFILTKEGLFKNSSDRGFFDSNDDTYTMLNRVLNVEVSDTTDVGSSNADRYIIIQLQLEKVIIITIFPSSTKNPIIIQLHKSAGTYGSNSRAQLSLFFNSFLSSIMINGR